jgi:hypothetical protein
MTLLVVLSLATSSSQAEEMLALACRGTITAADKPDNRPYPIGMGVIVNFKDNTVDGFAFGYPSNIIMANEMTVAFASSHRMGGGNITTTTGSINRVTGDVEATHEVRDQTSNVVLSTAYNLKCRKTDF